jgi:predicted CoA-binding protein
MSQDQTIQKLLHSVKTIAVVGLSSRPEKPAHYVPAYLQAQGYRIIPVNPYLEHSVLNEKVYPDLASIPEPVDLVLLFRRSEDVYPFVEQAIQIGASAVWMQLGIANAEAAELAQNAGLDVVMDACMLVEHKRFRREGTNAVDA